MSVDEKVDLADGNIGALSVVYLVNEQFGAEMISTMLSIGLRGVCLYKYFKSVDRDIDKLVEGVRNGSATGYVHQHYTDEITRWSTYNEGQEPDPATVALVNTRLMMYAQAHPDRARALADQLGITLEQPPPS